MLGDARSSKRIDGSVASRSIDPATDEPRTRRLPSEQPLDPRPQGARLFRLDPGQIIAQLRMVSHQVRLAGKPVPQRGLMRRQGVEPAEREMVFGFAPGRFQRPPGLVHQSQIKLTLYARVEVFELPAETEIGHSARQYGHPQRSAILQRPGGIAGMPELDWKRTLLQQG